MNMQPSDTGLPFELRRRQFPIRPSFAMTINKSQGQTMDMVGVYLPNDVFSHGQLYVALSRVGAADRLKVMVKGGHRHPTMSGVFTKNVVLRQLLSR